MLDLTLTIPNMRFLDTHAALTNRRIDTIPEVIDMTDSHGTRLTLPAKKYMTSCLVRSVELIVARKTGLLKGSSIRGWTLPLHVDFVFRFRAFASRLKEAC